MLPTLFDIADILFSEARYINFLLEEDILYKQAICPHCHIPILDLIRDGDTQRSHVNSQSQSSRTPSSPIIISPTTRSCYLAICS